MVVSWTVAHGKPEADGTTDQCALVLVELDEGPWILGRYVGGRDALEIGANVTVRFERVAGGEPVPVFVSSASG